MRRLLLLCWLVALLFPPPAGGQTPEATPEPGMRGTGPCDGLKTYQGFYLVAYSSTSYEHSEALELLRSASESDTSAEDFASSLTSEDMLLLRDYYLALAAVMDELSPPDFARDWHRLQQESLQLTGEIYGDAATLGLSAAGAMHSADASALIEALNTYFGRSSPCPAFLTWAREQSVLGSVLT